jgi:hypothetical protein
MMNRIYQGRVTQVQQRQAKPTEEAGGPRKARTDTKEEWVKIKDGETLLWRHHELFQDAVN